MAPLDHLRTFLAIYRTGSLTRAAGVVHLSQPALSLQLKALEASLGQPLFVRMPRGLAPTRAAHDLAEAVAAHVDGLAAALEARGEVGRLTSVRVRVGAPAELGSTRVAHALAPLVERGMRLDLRFDLAAPLLDALAKGELDVVVSTVRAARRGVVLEPLYEETFVLVAGRAWAARIPLRGSLTAGSRRARALLAAPWVAYAEDLPLIRRYHREVLLSIGERSALTPRMVAPDLRAVRSAVIAGAGISVLPRYLCAGALASGALIELATPKRPPTNVIHLARRSAVPAAPAAMTVAETLQRAAAHW